jgi:hypothetical protein
LPVRDGKVVIMTAVDRDARMADSMTAAEADVIAMAAAEVEEGKDKPDRQEVENFNKQHQRKR